MTCTQSFLDDFVETQSDKVKKFAEPITIVFLFYLFAAFQFAYWKSTKALTFLGIFLRISSFLLKRAYCNTGLMKIVTQLFYFLARHIYGTTPISMMLPGSWHKICMERNIPIEFTYIKMVQHSITLTYLLNQFHSTRGEQMANGYSTLLIIANVVCYLESFGIESTTLEDIEQFEGSSNNSHQSRLEELRKLAKRHGFFQNYILFKAICFTVSYGVMTIFKNVFENTPFWEGVTNMAAFVEFGALMLIDFQKSVANEPAEAYIQIYLDHDIM
ncbi:unnamed protein product [Caenorhabditis angaria]|uniref:Uncharacterized protein n=1 Tax=Caenorhabditis angaria TaxID=860376 RepID=A0A9P1J3B9_9PELO|nr:unnamed protein product [Caenorhabditis angaria]